MNKGAMQTDSTPAGFAEFWGEALSRETTSRLDATIEPFATPLLTIDSFDVRFTGAQGSRVAAWLNVPHDNPGPLPCVVQFVGYGGGRGPAIQHTLWASAGYAHLVVDTRGQGSDTADDVCNSGTYGVGPVTHGLHDRDSYYYRRVFLDAVRAVETAAAQTLIDESRIAVLGTSQGGGIALAAAALSSEVAAAMIDVPFLCDFPLSIGLAETAPYLDLAEFMRKRPGAETKVLETLSYFDGVHLAAMATCPGLWSVALKDRTCPPAGILSAYGRFAGPKLIEKYPFSDHTEQDWAREGTQAIIQMNWLAGLFGN